MSKLNKRGIMENIKINIILSGYLRIIYNDKIIQAKSKKDYLNQLREIEKKEGVKFGKAITSSLQNI